MTLPLPRFEPLNQERVQFFAERRERILALYPRYSDLRSKLLDIGGIEVVLPLYHELSGAQRSRQRYETQRILEAGQTRFGSVATLVAMVESNCHVNTANLFTQGRGSIASGFALSDDGLWREHSWLLDGQGRIVETTVLRLLYHGYALSGKEQGWFVKSELGLFRSLMSRLIQLRAPRKSAGR